MVCLFLFLPAGLFAQVFTFDKHVLEAYERVLDLRLESARSMIPDPQTPQEIYVVSLSETLELIVTENPRNFTSYETSFEKRTSRKTRKDNADELTLQAELNLQWAYVYLKFGKELDAALRLRQAYLYTHDVRKRFPEYEPILKTAGLLNVMIGSVPDKYNWILGLLGMEGSVNTGLSQLKKLAASNHPFAFESTLWHAFTTGFMLQQPEKAILEMEYVLTLRPQNPLALFMIANFHMKNGSSEEALKYLRPELAFTVIYTNYLRGEVFLHKADYTNAVHEYSLFLHHYRGQNYIKDAHYKIGLCYWLDGKQDEAIIAFREAESNGKEVTEADKHAAKNLASSELPSVPLTRARFFTDGGYYREAEEIFNSIDPESLRARKHQVEFFYRKARLYHKLERTGEARENYLKTIDMSADEEWYFAPNACLQLGYIAIAQGQSVEARRYFEQALSYRRHEYKNSIDSKARSALAQLKDLK